MIFLIYWFKRVREREISILLFYLGIYLLILLCVLTGDQTHNLGVWGWHTSQLSYPARTCNKIFWSLSFCCLHQSCTKAKSCFPHPAPSPGKITPNLFRRGGGCSKQLPSWPELCQLSFFYPDLRTCLLILERREGRERERERNINVRGKHWSIASYMLPRLWAEPSTQACALSRNSTPNLSVFGLMPQPPEPHQPGQYSPILCSAMKAGKKERDWEWIYITLLFSFNLTC